MSKHVELATSCPNCQSRLTLSVRRTPLIGFHAVRLACENGCDLHWYYDDLPNRWHGFRPPKAAPKTPTASFVAASNTWTRCSRPNVRNAGSARKWAYTTGVYWQCLER